jgi:transposase
MPAAYSYDLRERVVDAVERGSSRRRAAVVFKVSAATVVRWTKRLAETGSFAAAPTGGDFKSKAVEELMSTFSERECRNFLTHQGYVST